jgi:Domain of unknown function (DUF4340)
MNFKTTLVLVLLLAAVGGYFYFVEYGKTSGYDEHQRQQSAATDTAAGTPLFDDDALTADTIDRIQIDHAGKTAVVAKENDQWFQTQPVRFALESYRPRNVAQRFAELRYVKKLEPGSPDAPTIEQMDLDKPRAVVTAYAGEKKWTLKLGRLTLAGHGYVQVEGSDTVYVVDAALHGAVLDDPVTEWRSKSLDAPTAARASSIYLDQADGELIDLLKVDGRWRFDSKDIQRTSQDAVDDWFSAIGRVWINQFIEDNPQSLSIYGLDKPYLRITLTVPEENEGETRYTLTIGNTDLLSGEQRYAAWTRGDEPITVVFTVDAAGAQALARTPPELYDPKVIVADTYDVRGLTVEQNGETTLNLIRDPQEGYRFGDPDPGFDADYSASHSLVKGLCELKSTRHVQVNAGMGEPIAEVRVTLAGSEGGSDFSIYEQGEDRIIVTQGESVGYLVPASELETLLGPPLGLRKRTVLDLAPDQIAGVKLRRGGEQELSFLPGDEKTTWRLEGQQRFEQEDFKALIGSLSPLRAERWLGEQVTPGADWITLTVEPVGGAPITIDVDPADGRAVMSGLDSAFVLPQPVVDRLNAEYRNRTVLDLSADQIESVTLASNETSVTISRDGQRFITDTPGEIDQAVAAGVFDALAGLRAQRYVSPLNLRPQDVRFSIQVKTADQAVPTLRFVGLEAYPTTVSLERFPVTEPLIWFTLPQDVIDRLHGPLTEIEAPLK